MEIHLDDPHLFGNEVAEDEDEEIFLSYVMERAEVQRFLNAGTRMSVVRAYKGEGKSALLRLTELRLRDSKDDPLVLRITGSKVAPPDSGSDTDAWIRAWKAQLLTLLAKNLGAQIGMAWSDDAITLVYRSKNTDRNLARADTVRREPTPA